jgi:hypothetical protein
VSSPILDSRQPELSARDILARLERYAAAYRVASPSPSPRVALAPTVRLLDHSAATLEVPTDDFQPHARQLRRLDPATADLFPYDLAVTIVGCVATILAYRFVAAPVALAITVGLLAAGEGARRRRWFPSAGVNLMIGVLAGAILVFTA